MSDFATGGILAGATNGFVAFGKIMRQTTVEPVDIELLELDFRNIEVATSSFMREGVLAIRNAIRGRGSNFYPVLVDANQSVIDELAELAAVRNEVFVFCIRNDQGELVNFSLIGRLEAKQDATLRLVKKHLKTDATELMKKYGGEEGMISPTAWNNRLASLAQLGLVAEKRFGRLKKYHMIFDGVI